MFTFFRLALLSMCLSSLTAYAFNDGDLNQIRIGEPGIVKGEVIQPLTNQQIAAWCDFSKQIVTTPRNNTLCVFNGWTPTKR